MFTNREQKFTKCEPKKSIMLFVEKWIMQRIGARLKEIREKKGLRQEQAAEIFNVTKSTLSQYESDIRQPSLEMVVAFARFYRVSTDYILGATESKTIDISELSDHESFVISELISILLRK